MVNTGVAKYLDSKFPRASELCDEFQKILTTCPFSVKKPAKKKRVLNWNFPSRARTQTRKHRNEVIWWRHCQMRPSEKINGRKSLFLGKWRKSFRSSWGRLQSRQWRMKSLQMQVVLNYSIPIALLVSIISPVEPNINSLASARVSLKSSLMGTQRLSALCSALCKREAPETQRWSKQNCCRQTERQATWLSKNCRPKLNRKSSRSVSISCTLCSKLNQG